MFSVEVDYSVDMGESISLSCKSSASKCKNSSHSRTQARYMRTSYRRLILVLCIITHKSNQLFFER